MGTFLLGETGPCQEGFIGPRTGPAYPPEFRHQMVELVRAGRTREDLAKEFESSAQTIRCWAIQERVDTGDQAGLTSDEREEFA